VMDHRRIAKTVALKLKLTFILCPSLSWIYNIHFANFQIGVSRAASLNASDRRNAGPW
jgi:hypothetical protein